ncbi:MAG: glycerophosphodiester phosphodiesterase [Sphingobium sp.]
MNGLGLLRICLLLLSLLIVTPAATQPPANTPLLIAHRGASGERPEHTLASYERAIDQGADYVEPDLVLTKDGILVARHENEIGGTTDVASHPEFADRRTTRTIDGKQVEGWFTEDFTLAELRTLRARERLPEIRAANTRFDKLYQVPTFEEILELVRAKEAETGRRIGVYPETKHPSYFAGIGLPHQAPMLALLTRFGYLTEADPVFLQSFEIGNLKALRAVSRLRIIQLIEGQGGPADMPDLTYDAMMTLGGLQAIAEYADGIGPAIVRVLTPEGPTNLVRDAHEAGLQVHVWTLRRENGFLPDQYKRPDDPNGIGDFPGYVRAVAATGVDAVFTDSTQETRAALTAGQ